MVFKKNLLWPGETYKRFECGWKEVWYHSRGSVPSLSLPSQPHLRCLPDQPNLPLICHQQRYLSHGLWEPLCQTKRALSCRSFQHWCGRLTSGLWLCLNLTWFCCVVPVNQTAFCIWLWDCLVTGLILITTVVYSIFLSLLGPTPKPDIQSFSKSRCKCLITKCHQETSSKGFNNRVSRSRGHPLGENKHMWPSMWGKKN